MATYKEIIGTNVESRSSDPSNPVEGQVWYNSTTGALKGASVSAAGAWATGGGLNTARAKIGGTATSRDSSLVAGGQTPTRVANTESYNGSSWTEVADLNTVKSTNSSAGTTTAAISIGGRSPSTLALSETELWNGSSWTEVADQNTGRREISGSTAGTSTAAIIAGGQGTPTPSRFTETETWNGSSWTEVADLNLARNRTAQVGTQTAALCFGGATDTFVDNTEIWNGSSWTEVADLGTARYSLSGAGTSTDALGFGGYKHLVNPSSPHAVAFTEAWNGSSWTEVADLNTARDTLTGNGTSTSAIAVGGATAAGTQSATEEWAGAGAAITRTFTTS